MAILPIKQSEFYTTLTELVNQSRVSVHFYSVSCCFGFYSEGLQTFENVYVAMRDVLSRLVRGQYLDVRLLLKIDRGNPIDLYAAERVAGLEKRFAHTGDSASDRNIARELPSDSEAVQFLVIDDNLVLISEIQDEMYNEDLDLVLNKSQRGKFFERADDQSVFDQYKNMFELSWVASSELKFEIKEISLRKLKFCIENYFIPKTIRNERELQLILMGYLQGLFDPSVVDLERSLGGTRIDLLVGHRPHHKRYGIELKIGVDDGSVDAIVGKMRNYRKEFENLMLVVARSNITPQRRKDLLEELRQIDVIMLEI